jgi:hypothetical protein
MTDQWKKEIEDALTVMGGLQARQGRALREHSEWLESHQKVMQKHEEWLQSFDQRMDKLVVAIGELIQRNGGAHKQD